MRKRNEWDVLKCLATLLVVIGHIVILYKQGGSFPAMENPYLAMFADVIYLFHMPLFVTISGAVYAIGKQFFHLTLLYVLITPAKIEGEHYNYKTK